LIIFYGSLIKGIREFFFTTINNFVMSGINHEK